MKNNDINEKVLDNPFSKNLLDNSLLVFENITKRNGFNLTGNNYHLLSEKEKYILAIEKVVANLIETIDQLHFIKTFLKRYPNKLFFLENGINQMSYIQYHSEVLFHKVHTVLEIMKHLVNEVYCLKLKNNKCSWDNLKSSLGNNNQSLIIIDSFFITFKNIIDNRHVNSHRGIFKDKEKEEIDIDFGYFNYNLHELFHDENYDEYKRIFPKHLIDFKIKEYRSKRIKLIINIEEVVFLLVREFLSSLNNEFERKIISNMESQHKHT